MGILSVILFVPLVAAVLVLFIPKKEENSIRALAIVLSLIPLALSSVAQLFPYLTRLTVGRAPSGRERLDGMVNLRYNGPTCVGPTRRGTAEEDHREPEGGRLGLRCEAQVETVYQQAMEPRK